jgi:hypothetical protein
LTLQKSKLMRRKRPGISRKTYPIPTTIQKTI